MAAINVSGHVQHVPGNWGASASVRGATIEVYDIDGLGVEQIIWTGTTDQNGNFSGRTRDWQNQIRLRYWVQESLIPGDGHWETTSTPDPTDILLLKLRVRQGNRTHDVLPFLNGMNIPVVVPWGPPTATADRDTRALVVVNNTVQLVPEKRALYTFIEASGDLIARNILAPVYRSITSLNGTAATLDALCDTLTASANTNGVNAVDLVINMHGDPGVLFFAGPNEADRVDVTIMGDRLAALGLSRKLRLVYNTSCYGDSHSQAFLAGGFNASIGSKEVNTASTTEYPILLALWATNARLRDALPPSQVGNAASDTIARNTAQFGNEIDSTKIIAGNDGLRITSQG